MTRTWIAGHWTGIALLLGLLAIPRPALAASVDGSVASDPIAIGESTDIEIRLNLGVGEEASIFEGRFDLIGSGATVEDVVPADLSAGGPSWGTSFGGIVGTQAQVSLTSANTGGNRLVAMLTVTGKAPGTFQIALASGTFAQRDLDVPPFVEDVPLTPPVGTVLATVTVAGNPPAIPALSHVGFLIFAGLLLAIHAFLPRRRKGRA